MASSYGENLKRLRERRGWSQTQLAERAEMDPSSISMIETGRRNPRSGTVRKLAEALGVYTAEIMGDAGAPAPRSEAFGQFARVPLVRAAHAGSLSTFQETGEFEWVPADLEAGRSLLGAPILGDCLEPTIEAGDTVLWDRRRRDPQHGEIVVVTSAEGELLVKRAVRTPDGSVWLTDRHNALEQPNGTRIEGVVVRIIKIPGRAL